MFGGGDAPTTVFCDWGSNKPTDEGCVDLLSVYWRFSAWVFLGAFGALSEGDHMAMRVLKRPKPRPKTAPLFSLPTCRWMPLDAAGWHIGGARQSCYLRSSSA